MSEEGNQENVSEPKEVSHRKHAKSCTESTFNINTGFWSITVIRCCLSANSFFLEIIIKRNFP